MTDLDPGTAEGDGGRPPMRHTWYGLATSMRRLVVRPHRVDVAASWASRTRKQGSTAMMNAAINNGGRTVNAASASAKRRKSRASREPRSCGFGDREMQRAHRRISWLRTRTQNYRSGRAGSTQRGTRLDHEENEPTSRWPRLDGCAVQPFGARPRSELPARDLPLPNRRAEPCCGQCAHRCSVRSGARRNRREAGARDRCDPKTRSRMRSPVSLR